MEERNKEYLLHDRDQLQILEMQKMDAMLKQRKEDIWSGKITAITTYHGFGIERIEYRVFVEEGMHFTFKEEYLFPTKEELLKSL